MTAPAPPQNIYNKVKAIAIRYGVPDGIWEDVAFTESGYNPNATHLENNGNLSVGLFQLEENVGQGAGFTTAQLKDPTVNATVGMPAIARAWNNNKGSFQANSISWWEKFGAESGHPGGPAGSTVNANEARILMANYPGGIPATPPAINPTTKKSVNTDCCKGDLQCEICINLNNAIGNPGIICCPGVAQAGIQGTFAPWMAQIETLFQNAFVKGALIAFALMLIIVGFLFLRG